MNSDQVIRRDHAFDSKETIRKAFQQIFEKGDSLHDIGRLFDRGHSSIQNIKQGAGGIRPRDRKRSVVSLTLAERKVISIGLAMGQSLRTFATQIQRSPSTVSRELKRNEGRYCYRAAAADEMAWQRTLRPKACKLVGELKLIRVISEKPQCEWSPEQISGWLKREYPHDKSYHVSHETIYKSLFIQIRGVLKKELLACLRSRRVMRRSRHATQKGKGLGGIVDAVNVPLQ